MILLMINNEDNKYIILRKDLYYKFGFAGGLIVQLLVNGKGEFIGSTGTMHDIISVVSLVSVKNHLKELERNGVIITERIGGWCNKYKLSDMSLIENEYKLHNFPEKVQHIVEKLNEIKKKKTE